jgi:hypothetical protein
LQLFGALTMRGILLSSPIDMHICCLA